MRVIGDRIKTERRVRGWDQAALAEASGISHGYIRQLETNQRVSPKYDTLQKIAGAFGITVDELVHGRPVDTTKPPSVEMLDGLYGPNEIQLIHEIWLDLDEGRRAEFWRLAQIHQENRQQIAEAQKWIGIIQDARSQIAALEERLPKPPGPPADAAS